MWSFVVGDAYDAGIDCAPTAVTRIVDVGAVSYPAYYIAYAAHLPGLVDVVVLVRAHRDNCDGTNGVTVRRVLAVGMR
jgi:hypothetical protein